MGTHNIRNIYCCGDFTKNVFMFVLFLHKNMLFYFMFWVPFRCASARHFTKCIYVCFISPQKRVTFVVVTY